MRVGSSDAPCSIKITLGDKSRTRKTSARHFIEKSEGDEWTSLGLALLYEVPLPPPQLRRALKQNISTLNEPETWYACIPTYMLRYNRYPGKNLWCYSLPGTKPFSFVDIQHTHGVRKLSRCDNTVSASIDTFFTWRCCPFPQRCICLTRRLKVKIKLDLGGGIQQIWVEKQETRQGEFEDRLKIDEISR